MQHVAPALAKHNASRNSRSSAGVVLLGLGARPARKTGTPVGNDLVPSGDVRWLASLVDRIVVTPEAAAVDPSSDRLEGAPAEPPGRTCKGPTVVSSSMPMRITG